jgi:hypothetical protein
MEWRCEWCEKRHAENDPPCDNCGHGTFVEAGPDVEQEVVPGGTVWVCQNCGRTHQKNNPPCKRCGGVDFKQRAAGDVSDPMDDIGTRWRDIVEPKYVAGYVFAAALLGVLVLSTLGVITLPGAGTAPDLTVPDAPGEAGTVGNLSLSAVESAYVTELNERRTGESAEAVARNASADEAAAYYNKGLVDAYAGDGEEPNPDAVSRVAAGCEDPVLVSYRVAPDRTGRPVTEFGNETALATALVDSYVERGASFGAAPNGLVGVDVHVAPDDTVFTTHVLC